MLRKSMKTRDELIEELMEAEEIDQLEAEQRVDELLSKKENNKDNEEHSS